MDITRQNPGQTFVGILPGHDRPAFVRKRSRRRSGSCFTDMFRPRRTYSSEHVIHHTYTESNRPYYFTRPSSPHQTKIVTNRPVVISSSGPSLPDRLKKVCSFECNPAHARDWNADLRVSIAHLRLLWKVPVGNLLPKPPSSRVRFPFKVQSLRERLKADFENPSIVVRYRSRACAEDAFTARPQVARVIVATRITSRKRSVGVVGRKENGTIVATNDTVESKDADARV